MKHTIRFYCYFGLFCLIFSNSLVWSNEKLMEAVVDSHCKSNPCQSYDSQKVQKLGYRLENNMLKFVQNQQVSQYSKRISIMFQAGHTIKGASNRDQEIALIKKIDLKYYVITNFFATQCGDTLVCSYDLEATQFLFGEYITSNALRISVWKKNREGLWQWISHSNFVEL